ncbi:DUF3014 domain-containing protein [Idiomarina aquatica]|uniref:DUF3014 domain-containing protein n=1 Tax=Idiomarina aquatica TaxID=1327752 RepID=A0AA94EEZ0_9GAMM|nr:DUF3014 domain-containing protein [Idiomarina aquatica]RUO42495.1 DUF3014 domain-containing protein [Idiomarina aquatica]
MTDNQTEQHEEPSGAGKAVTWTAVAIIVIAVIAAVIWWLTADKPTEMTPEPAPQQQQPVTQTVEPEAEPEPEQEPEEPSPAPEPETVAEAAPEPEPEPESEPELPPLDQSTPTVLQTLDSSGIVIQPLKSSQLVRDAVVIIDNLRNGTLVRDRTIVQRPDGRFSVMEIDGKLYIDERSYQRYDALVDWFISMDNQALAENFDLFEPLLQDAFAEIGYPDAAVSDALYEAMDVLLATPVPETLVEVEDDEVMYTYANPAYEALPPAQKQLLRMGPDNIERIKDKLRELKQVFQANL